MFNKRPGSYVAGAACRSCGRSCIGSICNSGLVQSQAIAGEMVQAEFLGGLMVYAEEELAQRQVAGKSSE